MGITPCAGGSLLRRLHELSGDLYGWFGRRLSALSLKEVQPLPPARSARWLRRRLTVTQAQRAPLSEIHPALTPPQPTGKDPLVDKMPAYRWRDARRLASFLRNSGPKIARALEPEMTAVLEDGEELPDLARLLDVLGRMVLAKQADLDEQDDDKADHNANAASARLELRRDAMQLLRSRVKEVRQWLRGHLAPEDIKELLGFKGRTPGTDEGREDLATVMVRRRRPPVIVAQPTPRAASPRPCARPRTAIWC